MLFRLTLTTLLLALSLGCSKYKKEKWVIEGTLYQDCDLQIPFEGHEVDVRYFYRKTLRRLNYSASTSTTNTGYFKIEYESEKKQAEDMQIMGIEVPYRQNIDLGSFSKQINASIQLKLTNGEKLTNKDTVVVFLSENFNTTGFIKIPGPFTSVDLGTYPLVQARKNIQWKNGTLGIEVPIRYTLYNNNEKKRIDFKESFFITTCGTNQQMVITNYIKP
ncbi:MAG: hypothetical protein N4A41_12275 [Crocinitomicaceae bacterium]|jgi:hypothetical protein|nr:hypothetical protein [Crocinitomicaceae bacterium]